MIKASDMRYVQNLRRKVKAMDEFEGKKELYRALESVPGYAKVTITSIGISIDSDSGHHLNHPCDDQTIVGLRLLGL